MSETWRTPNFDESAGEQSGQPADSANSSGGYANPYPGQGSYPGAGYDGGAGVPGVGADSAAGAGYPGATPGYPGQAVLPPLGLVATLAPPLVTLAVTRAAAHIRVAVLIRALAMDQDLMAPQTSMSTSLALSPYAPCLLATSTRVRLRQLKLTRTPCLVLLPPY